MQSLSVLEIRQTLLHLLDYGLYQQAEGALEGLLLDGPAQSLIHWTDYYKYCLLLERTGRFTALLTLIDSLCPPKLVGPGTDTALDSSSASASLNDLQSVLFESLRMRALRGVGLWDCAKQSAKLLIAHLPEEGDDGKETTRPISKEDPALLKLLPPGYYPPYKPSLLRAAALSLLAAGLREGGKLSEWRQGVQAALQLNPFEGSGDTLSLAGLGPVVTQINALFVGERPFEALMQIREYSSVAIMGVLTFFSCSQIAEAASHLSAGPVGDSGGLSE